MNRRSFLKCLAGGAAGFALDPERLLWVPGQRTHFVMPGIESPPLILLHKTVSSADVIAMFKHVYGADRLAALARMECTLWERLDARRS
jgi:hypothetical protein